MIEKLQNYTQQFMETSNSFINQQLYQEYSGLVSRFSKIRTPLLCKFSSFLYIVKQLLISKTIKLLKLFL